MLVKVGLDFIANALAKYVLLCVLLWLKPNFLNAQVCIGVSIQMNTLVTAVVDALAKRALARTLPTPPKTLSTDRLLNMFDRSGIHLWSICGA